MKTTALVSLLLTVMIRTAAQLPDPSFVIVKSRDLTMTAELRATITLTITEKNGTQRNRIINMSTKTYDGGVEKRMIKFLDPPDVKGTAMLIIDNPEEADEMWIYLPALKKTRRIISREKGKSFMNSEFSNADMSSPPVTDFIYSHTNESGMNNQLVIESIPADVEKADEYGYSRKVIYLDKEDFQIKKMEFFDFDNNLFKIIEIREICKLPDGKITVSDMSSVNLSNKRESQFRMSEIAASTKVDDSVFSIQNLER